MDTGVTAWTLVLAMIETFIFDKTLYNWRKSNTHPPGKNSGIGKSNSYAVFFFNFGGKTPSILGLVSTCLTYT